MKQEEKNRRSREHILAHAFDEFAEHGYSGAGLNQICARGRISKGLLYHYYEGKDALYIACMERVFGEMTASLRSKIELETVTVESYFAARMSFFRSHPQHRQLFYDVLMYPQSHLAGRISECRAEFDEFNDRVVKVVLSREKLSEHITADEAISLFRAFVNFLGVYAREDSTGNAEMTTTKLLNTMLYGIIAR